MDELYPPRLPKKHQGEYWVGTRDAFSPQLNVIPRHSHETICRASLGKLSLTFEVTYRMGDFAPEESDEKLGEIEFADISDISVNEDGSINFMATTLNGFGKGIWVWEYESDSPSAPADFWV